jgi:hypothetical protein
MSILVGSGRLAHFRVGTEEAGVNLAHVKVTWDESGISVTDNGSYSGTFINGEQVETAVLLDGDRITFQPPGGKLQPPEVLVRIPAGSVMVTPLPPPPEAAPTPGKPAPATGKPASAARPTPSGRGGPRSGRTLTLPFLGEITLPDIQLPEISLPSLPQKAPERAPKGAPRGRGGRRASRASPVLIGGIVGGLVALVVAYLVVQRFFFAAPIVTSVNPASADTGATVTVSGRRFDPEPTRNTVWFGDKSTPPVTGTETLLSVRVPEAPAGGGSVTVQVQTDRGRSKGVPFTIRTVLGIGALDPEAALPGDEVTIKGQGFAEGPAAVTVAGRTAQILETQRTSLRFKMPAIPLEPGTWMPVLVRVGSQTAKPMELLMGRLPVVLQCSPPRGSAGDRVVVKGRGFSAESAGNSVTFSGTPALVLQATAQELEVLVPPARGGEVEEASPVVVRAGGKESSNRATFTIVRPAGGAYVFRFFAAPATETGSRMVYVASEPGPALLLSSPESAPSAASRAIKVAAALNGAFDQARNGQPVAFEARRDPFPGVGLSGSSELIVQATPDDAAAHAAPPGFPPRGVPSLPALVEHWAAVLNDTLAIFVLNEKPARVLALSPKGRAFLELRSAVGWRAGTGIPTDRIASLSPDIWKRVREASLVVAAAGEGSPAAVVEGTWEGEMEDDAGPRAIVVKLRVEGSGLTGRLTSQRALSMEAPLRDISFQKDVLRFTLPAGNATRLFVGRLSGSTLSGTLHATANGPQVGTFTLKNAP